MVTSISFDKSDTGVANLALTYIGDKNIKVLTEEGREAKVLRRFYTQARDLLLETKPWTWPGSIETLAAVENDWPERWGYKYTYGSDWLKFIGIIKPGADPRFDRDPIKFQIFGRAVYTDMAEARAMVVLNQTDVQTWPAYFIEALAADLAHRAVMPLTKNVKLEERVAKQKEAVFATALAADANQDSTPPDYTPASIEARA